MTQQRVRPTSIRTRLLTGMIALTTLTLLVAGTVSYIYQRHQLNERLDESLVRTVEEIRHVAKTVDPNTLKPFRSAEELVYAGMQQTMLGPTQGMIGIGNQQVHWKAPESVEIQLDEDPEFMGWAHQLSTQNIQLATVRTPQRTYRAAAVPVQLESDDEPCTFIVAYDYSAEVAQMNTTYAVLAGVGGAIMGLAAVLAWLLVGRMLQPIRRLRETAQDISESEVSTRIPVTGKDEFAELTITINQMLDRLESALKSQRQLLDDVGHELRTPVTIIRGHLELMDEHDAADVTQSRDIAVDELDRMSVLINDLVTLAKAQRQDFVHFAEVDVDRLLTDIVDKASALGRRQFSLATHTQAVVTLDAQRITQAMLQLCDNAVKYTPEGTRVEVGARLMRQTDTTPVLALWVKDDGAGIAAAEQERIFQRFGRGSNAQRADGSGLGLSIVSAIAEAHGGTLQLKSPPGSGAQFIISIPLKTTPVLRSNNEPDPHH